MENNNSLSTADMFTFAVGLAFLVGFLAYRIGWIRGFDFRDGGKEL